MDSWHAFELADSGLHAMFPKMDMRFRRSDMLASWLWRLVKC